MSALQAYSSYKESRVEWIGQIPAHWRACRTKFVAKLYSGHTPSRDKPEYWVPEECTIPWFTLADVWQLRDGTRTYLGDTSEKISPVGLANSAARLLPADTVIVSRTASVGFAGIMPRPMATTQDFVNWVCGDRIRPPFLLHVFRAMRGEFSRLTMGSTHQTIYMPEVRSFSTPLPPLDEQEEIIAFLDRETARIDGLIAKKRRLTELLREKRQAAISDTVTKGLDPTPPMKHSGIEWLGEIPTHWEVKPLMYLTPETRQIMYGIVLPGPHFEGGVPIVKGGDVAPGKLRLAVLNRTDPEIEARYERSRLKGGDLVYAIRGSIGAVELVPDDLEGANLTQDAARVAPREGVNRRWLLHALRASPIFGQLEAGAVGATIRGINIRDLKRARLPVPPPEEQQAIADFCDAEDRLVAGTADTVEKAIVALKEHRAALIAAAVTGKIDVRTHPADAVEAAD